MKVVYKMKSRFRSQGGNGSKPQFANNRSNIIISVSGRIHRWLTSMGRVFVGFNCYRVEDSITVTRCYKCQGFGHTFKECHRPAIICCHCSEERHTMKDCPKSSSKPCYINCKLKKKPSEHQARDRNCEEYKRNVELLRSRIDYA